MAKTQKYTNLAMRQLNQALKVTKDLEDKDLRDFQIKVQIGKFEEENSGVALRTKFGIVDAKSEPVLSIKESLGF